jgi:hypothetical protein
LDRENYIIQISKPFFAYVRRAIRGLWWLFDAFNDDEMYLDINFKDVSNEYFESKIESLEEFCASYTYAKHEKAKLLDNSKSKSKMYNELLAFFKAREQQGKN